MFYVEVPKLSKYPVIIISKCNIQFCTSIKKKVEVHVYVPSTSNKLCKTLCTLNNKFLYANNAADHAMSFFLHL